MIHKLLEKVLFRPSVLPNDYAYSFETSFEELFCEPEAGVILNALLFKVSAPRGVILYFHGNRDNLVRWGEIAASLTIYGFDVLVMDYRGYGKSTGTRSEEALFSDARLWHHQIESRYPGLKVVLFGRSLGTGIASWLASQINPAALILETPYYNMQELMRNFVPSFAITEKMNYRLRSHEYLQKSNFPILILHGTRDAVVPYKSGLKLFDSLHNPNKKMCTLPGGLHNNLSRYPAYHKALGDFLNHL